jgi:hypothetical protein
MYVAEIYRRERGQTLVEERAVEQRRRDIEQIR